MKKLEVGQSFKYGRCFSKTMIVTDEMVQLLDENKGKMKNLKRKLLSFQEKEFYGRNYYLFIYINKKGDFTICYQSGRDAIGSAVTFYHSAKSVDQAINKMESYLNECLKDEVCSSCGRLKK